MFLPLHHHGVLGLNARNLLYIKPFNPKKAVAFADDKMKTKAFLSARGIPTAKLFARIDTRRQLKTFDFDGLPDECVLKPNYGFGGEGIVILSGRKNGQFLEQGRVPVSQQELTEHIEDILDGKFSVNGQTDSAFFEQILRADESFLPLRPVGLPDIRIIVFNLVPVMAMLRIPTAESRGKANVHLGGIGIGIDIAKGVTTHAAQYHGVLKELPHGLPVAGMQIPQWEEMLLISSKIQYITNIGYLAVDLTLDRDLGPVLLEVNARAGLMVQVANLAPLRSRLKRVEGLSVSSPEKGVRIAQELFGTKVERPEASIDDKVVLGTRETIEIATESLRLDEPCIIAPEQSETIFSPSLIHELLALGVIESMEGARQSYRVKFSLGGRKIQTVVGTAELVFGTRVMIGSRDLKGFLIDPSKSEKHITRTAGRRIDLRSLDRNLCTIDGQLSLLRYLRPTNLREERERLQQDPEYNPVFLLRDFEGDLADLEKTVKKYEADESPLGILLKKKRREILLKIELLKSRGDAERFTAASLSLYGAPSPALLAFAEERLVGRIASGLPPPLASMKIAEEAKHDFESVLLKYGLHDWSVVIKSGMVADCAVGDRRVFLRTGASFSPEHLQALFAHEVETHVLTAENGRIQPYEIFRRGFANYLDTQEGLAIFSQMRVLSPYHEKNFQHAKNVLAVSYAMDHSFAEVRRYLQTELGFTPEKALSKSIDLKRGFTRSAETGAFTKALVYFRGLRAIDQYVKQGGDLRRLYIGKIAIEDLGLIEKMEEVKPSLVLPTWLREAVKPAFKSPTGRKPRKKT